MILHSIAFIDFHIFVQRMMKDQFQNDIIVQNIYTLGNTESITTTFTILITLQEKWLKILHVSYTLSQNHIETQFVRAYVSPLARSSLSA